MSTTPTTTTGVLLAVASGVLYALAFPPFDQGTVAFVALAPLVVAVHGATRWRAAVLGWLAGTIACTALVGPSIFAATSRYFVGRPFLAGLLALAMPQLYGALYFGVFGIAARELQASALGAVARVLALAAAWAGLELVRARIGGGCPWVLLAHAQHARLWILQVADLGGAYAVSFLVMLANAGVVAIWDGMRRRASGREVVAATATVLLVLVGARVYGERQLARWSAPAATTLRVGLVQPAIPAEWRTSLAAVPETMTRLHALTRQAAASRPELVVWPENAVSVLVEANAELLSAIGDDVGPDTHLLLGAPRAVDVAPGRSELRNSAFLLDGHGAVEGVYDKLRLTPYGEFVPWLARPFVGAAEKSTGYTAGDTAGVLAFDGRRFGTVICWEAIYADVVRTLVRDGAELLVNISNDDWFGGAPAIVQHFDAAALRAVESRRWLVRATNSGVTAVVDARGAVVAEAPRDVPAVLPAKVGTWRTLSFYTRWGDVFGWSCLAATLGLVLFGRTRERAG